ncbi:hypothetical protein M9H77_14253 [Catharanthus roseus]|uniref:Uncharacterized protein n=1 Tax=Catharanthus roseus TaxID=4058 RepID=A0ACC0BMP3_CATRO|nr:hypothetical protein M9H77_14253 [Catharanthus roseus]
MTEIQADPLAPLGAIWCTLFDCSQAAYTHSDYLRGNDNTYWGTQHAIHLDAWYHWRLRVRDSPAVVAEALYYPSDEYIRWYRGITRVYIGNPPNRDTRAHGYQPVGVDRWMMEVDDMASVVIREPPSSPSQMAVVMNKRGSRRYPRRGEGGGRPPVPPAPERHEHVDPSHVVVERGERFGSGQPTVDPFNSPNLDMPSFSLGLTLASQSLPSGSGTLQLPPALGLGFASFQSPPSTSYGFSGFRAPPPLGTSGSSTPHQPISQAFSSDEEEREEDMDGVQHFGFGHHVGKKTVRFTPSDKS